MTKLTDAQLYWIFTHRLSHYSGFNCNRRLTENGVAGTERICEGRAAILNGKLKVQGGCGEPCSYICDDTQALAKAIGRIIFFDETILEAKAEGKMDIVQLGIVSQKACDAFSTACAENTQTDPAKREEQIRRFETLRAEMHAAMNAHHRALGLL